MIRLSSVDPVEEILGGKSTSQDKAEGKHLTESLDLQKCWRSTWNQRIHHRNLYSVECVWCSNFRQKKEWFWGRISIKLYDETTDSYKENETEWERILLCLFSKKSVKINRSVGNSFSAKSISDYLKSEHHSIDNETLSKNAANALADFCICFVKKCHTLQMDFSYFEYGRKQSFHTFFIANPK